MKQTSVFMLKLMGFFKQILKSLYDPTVHINMQLSESTPRNEYEVTSTLSQKTD